MNESGRRLIVMFLAASAIGVVGGLLGVGGGILFVPLLVLLFGFEQHRAQGTVLIALVAPTGLLAFLNYARASEVDWRTGLLLMPGVFLGGVAGARLALRLAPRPMRMLFATLLVLAGAFELYDSWIR
ncbi:MAG TPA: sulfite exporter TauE/SafE family protein [Candidatus Acidoferrales bacterium]|nr:sulfite exporter TauE/SafE family protein [Candidatus Acidoferrales bacterium]